MVRMKDLINNAKNAELLQVTSHYSYYAKYPGSRKAHLAKYQGWSIARVMPCVPCMPLMRTA